MQTVSIEQIPYRVKINNVSSRERVIQMFKSNLRITLQPSNAVELKTIGSVETLYYLGLADSGLIVTKEQEAITYAVSLSLVDSATVEVKRESIVIDSSTDLNIGDVLKVTVTAADGYTVNSISINGASHTSGQNYTVVSDSAVIISVNAVKNCKVQITQLDPDIEGEIVVMLGEDKLANNSDIQTGDELVISVVPVEGQEIATLKVNNESFESGGTFIVGINDVGIVAIVKDKDYIVSCTQLDSTTEGEIIVMKGATKLNNGDIVNMGDILTISINLVAGKEIETLTVNDEPFESGDTFEVGVDNVEIVAAVKDAD